MPQKSIKPSYAFASLALAAAVSTLALATAGHAQPPRPDPAGANRPGAMAPNRDAMRGQMQQRMGERRAERDRDLATVLRLRPDQMPALQAFVASQTPQRMAAPPPPAPRSGALTTPQRLDRENQRSRDRDAFRQRREQGLRTFYAALAPDQQQVFDALTRLRGSDGRFGGRHGRHGMGGGRMGPGPMAGPGMGGPGGGRGGMPPGPPPPR